MAPEKALVPFNAGFSNNAGSYYCKTQEGIVVININAITSNPSFTSGNVIATLPAGFRPLSTVRVVAAYDNGTGAGLNYGITTIGTNGSITIALNASGTEKYMTTSIVFPTALS